MTISARTLITAALLVLPGCADDAQGIIPTDPPPTAWSDDALDIQDVSPWRTAGVGVGAPDPGSYLGEDSSHDPGCYRYFAAGGTGDGTSAATPAGDAIAAINAICASETARAAAAGQRLCLRRGDEFRGDPGPMSHALLDLAWCAGITIEDYGDQHLPRPRILGSRPVTGVWVATDADDRIYRVDLSADLAPGTTWTDDSGDSHTDEERVDQVFLDGAKLLLARHPNFGEGYADPTFDPRREPTGNSMLYIEENIPDARAFRDRKLPTTSILQNPVDWTGAHLHYKHATWIADGTVVTGYDPATHQLTTRSLVATAEEEYKGYFINDHLAALDSPGEWYYSPSERALYLWAPDDADPNDHRVDVSFARYNTPAAAWSRDVAERRGYDAVTLHYATGITLRNLELRHFSGDGLTIGAPNTVIEDCLFYGIGETAISAGYNVAEASSWGLGAGPTRLSRDWIEDAGCNGILLATDDSVAESCTILNVGSLEQYGPSGLGLDAAGCDLTYHETGFGLFMSSDARQTARRNFLERTGHNGVGFHGPGSVVEENVVHLASVTKGDSGAVKCWAWDVTVDAATNFARPGVTGSTVSRNIVVETIGTAEGVTFPGAALGNGFFIDFGCQGTTFDGNVAARSTTQGMLLTIDRDQALTGNTLFGNSMSGGAQIDLGDCELDTCAYTVQGNTLVSTAPFEQGLRVLGSLALTADDNTYFDPFAVAARPFDYNPWATVICSLTVIADDWADCHTLPTWRTVTGQDAASVESIAAWRDEYVSDYRSADLIPNAGFDTADTPWIGYLGQIAWDEAGPLGPSLRLDRDAGAEEASYQTTLDVTGGTRYELRLRAQGVDDLEPRLHLETMTDEWTPLVEPIGLGLESISLGSTARAGTVLFTPIADDLGYLRLTTAAARVWIDDVQLREVETYRVPRGVVLRPGDAVPRAARSILYINPSTVAATISLGGDTLLDLDGGTVSGSFTLPPFGSRALVAGSKLGLGKSERDLGTVPVGGAATQRPVLSSIGARPLAITAVRVAEAGSPFAVSAACDGVTLAPGAVCVVELSFAPTADGDQTATLVITTDDGQGAERTVTLRGRGQ
jgi:hypothetical protein